MRVLWFAGNAGMYANQNSYNGGGWIASLQRELIEKHAGKLDLAIAFPWVNTMKALENGTVYYGFEDIRRPIINYRKKEKNYLERLMAIVEDFKPDVIQVFGTENAFGLLCTKTKVPIVIHIQGILSAYKETWMPQGLSWNKYLLIKPMKIFAKWGLSNNVDREIKIFSYCKYFIGRTYWDESISRLLAPQSNYFYCSEMLRPAIYNSVNFWKRHEHKTKRIVSIISSPIYKGGDVVLRTAKILKKYMGIDFQWDIYGVSEIKLLSKLTGITPQDVNVNLCGIINAEQLVNVICQADVYMHPSYIENSPNTICETQLLGIPVVATNVGGISSLINHMVDGILVPANDVYLTASSLQMLLYNSTLSECLGINGRKTALERHDPEIIVRDVFHTYKSILKI